VSKHTLDESKKLGRHKGVITPWQHHAKVATVRAISNPQQQKRQQLVGQARVARRLHQLEANFKKALKDLNLANKDQILSSKRMKKVFRDYYRMSFQLGKIAGGNISSNPLPPLSNEDHRWLESFLRKEFEFWKKFVVSGVGAKSEAQRIEMYTRTLRGVYYSAKVLEVPPHTLFYWRTSPAEHCSHCLFLASQSPFTKANLPTVPRIGETKCLSNCKCQLQIKQVSLMEYVKVSRRSKPREELLRLMKALGKA